MSEKKKILLAGSFRRQPEGALRLGERPDPQEKIRVTLVLRPASSNKMRQAAIDDLSLQLPAKRKYLKRSEFRKQHGALSSDMAAVHSFASKYNLVVVESSREKRSVVLSGKISDFRDAFEVNFTTHKHEGILYRSYSRAVRIPPSLTGIVQAVLGLDNRPLMQHHFFLHAHHGVRHVSTRQVARTYRFPEKGNGKGQCVAIIELGGGFYRKDIEEYFRINGMKVPRITVVEVDGQRNNPADRELIRKMLDAMEGSFIEMEQTLDPEDALQALWTIESTLDLELIGSFANAAEIVIYFAPNNAQGKYRALTTALHSKKHSPSVISCSWGTVEENLTKDFVDSIEKVFQDAVLKGVSLCFSSGDRGDDPDQNGNPRVHYPASSPCVLSCGGTHWVEESPLKEVVWSEQLPKMRAQSGGGVSKFFPLPDWQIGAGVEPKTGRKGRGVPDVAGKADMSTGYQMHVGGYNVTMGGTSSVAPLWAALIACLNQELGFSIGFLNPLLYQQSFQMAVHDITEGNNGTHYQALPGWDACTGLGTPNGKRLLSLLKFLPY